MEPLLSVWFVHAPSWAYSSRLRPLTEQVLLCLRWAYIRFVVLSKKQKHFVYRWEMSLTTFFSCSPTHRGQPPTQRQLPGEIRLPLLTFTVKEQQEVSPCLSSQVKQPIRVQEENDVINNNLSSAGERVSWPTWVMSPQAMSFYLLFVVCPQTSNRRPPLPLSSSSSPPHLTVTTPPPASLLPVAPPLSA